ncbi:conjugative transfer ATPase [Vibrio tubiashii]|uniref:conjugative transfer ATPase n=1 Tax=Vibrio tubiashii TaxID=29498 RepID=UPI001EFD3212|nr:conjugative transfer ATPase [Vibrio tubiashii]MCG9576702.1 conjugative transfer ATPase [Vibrio tubiashii]
MGIALKEIKSKTQEQDPIGMLGTLVYAMRKTMAEFLDPDRIPKEEPITVKEHEALYGTYPRSIGKYMPYAGYDEKTRIFSFDDGVNSAIVFDVKPIPTEGRSEPAKSEYAEAIYNAVSSAFPELSESDGEWVVQQYRWKDDDLESYADEAYEYADAFAKECEFSKVMLQGVLKKNLRGMTRDEGLFTDSVVTGQPFVGGIERTKIVVYRKLGTDSLKAKRKINTAKQLETMARSFEIAMRAAGVELVRNTDFDFFYWLLKFFNERPEGMSAKSFLENVVPRADEDGDLPLGVTGSLFMNRPRYHEEENCYQIGDTLHKLVRVNGLSGTTDTGHLTGEIVNSNSVSCLTDQLPSGTMMCMTTVFVTKEGMLTTINAKEQTSQSNLSPENEAMRDACKHHRKVLGSRKARATKTSLVFYVRGRNYDELYDRVSMVNATLNNARLTPIVERKYTDPLAANAFIYNLPMCFDPSVKSAKSCLVPMYLSDVINMSFFFGREVGSGNPLLLMFNRSGSVLSKDILTKKDRQANAHMLVTGTTGAGKSATLVYLTLLLVAIKRPRLYIVEAGGSFRHVIEFLKAHGLSVNKMTIMPSDPRKNYKCPRFAPMEDAYHLVEDGVVELTPEEQQIAKYNRACHPDERKVYAIDKPVELDISPSEYSTGAKESLDNEIALEIEQHKQWMKEELAREQNPVDQEVDSSESEQKDRLGELELIAFSMATGGIEKEMNRYFQSDIRYLRTAIMNIGKSAYINNTKSSVSDLVAELGRISRSEDGVHHMYEDQRKRLNEMASAIAVYTSGFQGELLDQPTIGDEAFPDVDVTVIDLGTLAKPGNEALLGIVYVSLLQRLNGLAEKYQMSGRLLIKITDECHLVTKNVLTALYIVKVIKLWRKLNAFAWMATQNLNDFPGEAEKMLSMIEWIMMLLPNTKEISLLEKLKPLTDEQKVMAVAARKQDRAYTEGCLFGADFNALFRCVQPSESLAMAGTDGEEKVELDRLAKQYKTNLFKASMIKAYQLDVARGIEPLRYEFMEDTGIYDEAA